MKLCQPSYACNFCCRTRTTFVDSAKWLCTQPLSIGTSQVDCSLHPPTPSVEIYVHCVFFCCFFLVRVRSIPQFLTPDHLEWRWNGHLLDPGDSQWLPKASDVNVGSSCEKPKLHYNTIKPGSWMGVVWLASSFIRAWQSRWSKQSCPPHSWHGWHPSHAIAIACTPPSRSNCELRISLIRISLIRRHLGM